jgi:thiol:disulfide interchange protein
MKYFLQYLAIVFFGFAGYLLIASLKKFGFTINHPFIIALAIWGFGFMIFLSSFDKRHEASGILSSIGFIIMGIGAVIGIYGLYTRINRH